MIGRTLGVYFAMIFVRNTVYTFILFFSLIVVVDLIELSRELAKVDDVSFASMFLVSFLRAPKFAENILPFSILFGASFSLLLLNRRLELVVARASGVSVWQFLFPLVLSAIIFGAFSSLFYNDMALRSDISSKAIEAQIFGNSKAKFSSKSKNFWLRVAELEGDMVLRARVSQHHGAKLTAVSAYRFDQNGILRERIDAAHAVFKSHKGKNYYIFKKANILVPGKAVRNVKAVKIRVRITKKELKANQAKVSDNSIWQLPELIDRAKKSGGNPLPFITQFLSLTAQPLLFVAMVLLAGSISLTFARFGQNKKVILGGVLAGFVLYVLTKLVITFGSNGLVPPFIATWSPALIATLICTTVLMYQEDG